MASSPDVDPAAERTPHPSGRRHAAPGHAAAGGAESVRADAGPAAGGLRASAAGSRSGRGMGRDLLAWLVLAVVLLSVPAVMDEFFAYELGLYLLFGIVAQGIALAWGRAGFLPLGQALFFGLGAYLACYVLPSSGVFSTTAGLLLCALAPALLAYGVARLVFARRHESGPYFALITLALVMFGFQLANQWRSVTGGFNGISGVPVPFDLDRYSNYYYLVVAATLASTALVVWLLRTPLGTLWAAIAQNENRLQFFGFATDRLKAWAFAVSAGLGGLAGALFAGHQGIVTPQASSVVLSAEFVIWAAVGGRRSPYGALLGAVIIGMLSTYLRDHFAYWEIVIAVIFIVIVMRFPDGILGLLQGLGRALARRPPPSPGLAAEPGAVAPVPSYRREVAPATLRYDDVVVRQGSVRILNGLDLALDRPGLHCVIGPNGAGKTSSFNVLTGRLPLTSGHLTFQGRRVDGYRADAMARLGIGRKFQIPSVFAELTVADNLRIAQWANRVRRADMLRMATRDWSSETMALMHREFPFLAEVAHMPAGAISQGQRQMLEFAMTAVTEPVLYLLDEPCAGLSVDETRHLSAVIQATVRRAG
ncbi:MAG: ATP-binding cassette domain-containing protein, partial [Pigmentiphaga sp.]